MEQDELIQSIESTPETTQTQPTQPLQQQSEQSIQPLPQESQITPKKKRSFFDILTLISYIILAIAFGILAFGVILGNFL
jgi:hypothetical protein